MVLGREEKKTGRRNRCKMKKINSPHDLLVDPPELGGRLGGVLLVDRCRGTTARHPPPPADWGGIQGPGLSPSRAPPKAPSRQREGEKAF